MFQALFNSLSGLFSFSRSLDTVSNNVSNMNTPGFRGSDSFFSNVNGGRGTTVVGEGLRGREGEFRNTGNATDLAIDGGGFFVLRDPTTGGVYYTRAGQFEFNSDGILWDVATHHHVQAFDENGVLGDIDFTELRTLEPVATTQVNIRGSFNSSSTTPITVPSFEVFDVLGQSHPITVTLTPVTGTPNTFTVGVASGTTTGTATPATLALNVTSLTGTVTATINLGGVPRTFSLDVAATGVNGLSNSLTGNPVDGNGLVGFDRFEFDENGVLRVTYPGDRSETGPQIALARFPGDADMQMIGGRLIAGVDASERIIGRPGSDAFGSIIGNGLEMANVDLTNEFADMIIIQRGYQASSRVMTVSNEMIEQLYNSTRGG